MQHEATRVALHHHIDGLATEIGRLRRHPACLPDSSLAFLADRLASHVEALDCIVHPCAHDLYMEFFCVSGDHDLALHEALRATETRQASFRTTLGIRRAA